MSRRDDVAVASQTPQIVCRLCGLTIRGSDHVVEIDSTPESETVVHAACAEAAHVPPETWAHTDVKTLTEWARSIGWGSSA